MGTSPAINNPTMDTQHTIWTRINPSIKLPEELESLENEMEIIWFVGCFAYKNTQNYSSLSAERLLLPTVLQLKKEINWWRKRKLTYINCCKQEPSQMSKPQRPTLINTYMPTGCEALTSHSATTSHPQQKLHSCQIWKMVRWKYQLLLMGHCVH